MWLVPTGLRAAAGVVHEEHGVEVLPEHQPRVEAAGLQSQAAGVDWRGGSGHHLKSAGLGGALYP